MKTARKLNQNAGWLRLDCLISAVMSHKHIDNTTVLFGLFASGVYRVWWWSNYKSKQAQAQLRGQWRNHVNKYELSIVLDGYRDWCNSHGANDPPDPVRFEAFIKPVLSEIGNQSINQIKNILHGND